MKEGILNEENIIFSCTSSVGRATENFPINLEGEEFEIVHSLAKWKREALGKYEFPLHTGLYTDMKAIRKDEEVDATHSLYVEQWDWEVVIDKSEFKKFVELCLPIYYLIKGCEEHYEDVDDVVRQFKDIVTFITDISRRD